MPDEHFDEDLPVRGSIPLSLNGVYVRVGPNPYHRPIGNYHWCAAPASGARCTIQTCRRRVVPYMFQIIVRTE